MFRGMERWKGLTASVVIAFQLTTLLAPAASAANDTTASGSALVQKGSQAYDEARFADAIAILKDLVDRADLERADLQKAREYLARSYVKTGKYDLAKDTFRSLLKIAPNWRPDPVYVPPDEIDLFNEALKDEQAGAPPSTAPVTPEATPAPPPAAAPAQAKPLYKKWWVWAAGAAVVGGVAALAGGGKSSSASPLPGFPGPPSP